MIYNENEIVYVVLGIDKQFPDCWLNHIEDGIFYGVDYSSSLVDKINSWYNLQMVLQINEVISKLNNVQGHKSWTCDHGLSRVVFMVDWFYWFTMRQISFPIFLLVHYPVRAHGNQLMDSVKATSIISL